MAQSSGPQDQSPDLRATVDREAIRDLVARYNANGDSGRFAQVRELFAADAVMTIDGDRSYSGIDEIMTIFSSTKSTTAGALTHVRHFTATHQIDLVDEQNATGRLYFAVLTDIGLDHWGRYVDGYTKSSGRWLFASRKVSVDGWASNTLFPRL
ncbi:MAG: hypothetical protein RL391_1718 [Actinomycetota bacterium]|jgi:hypothetical protein